MIKKNEIKNYIFFAIESFFISWLLINTQRFFVARSRGVKVNNIQLFTTQRIILLVGLTISFFLLLTIISMPKKKKGFYDLFISLTINPFTIALLAIVSFRIFYYSQLNTGIAYYDTSSYLNDFKGSFSSLTPDIFRTPVYPYFLKTIAFLTSTDISDTTVLFQFVVRVQMMLSLLSCVILYLAMSKLLKNKYIISVAVLIYGCAPIILQWDALILTESLSLFCTIVFLWLILTFLKNPTIHIGIIMGLFVFFMIMLRPTFVYLFAILGVFFIARFILCKADRRQVIAGFLALLASGALLLGYCGLNKKNYDYFGISSVSTCVNKLYIVASLGIYENEDYPEISEFMHSNLTTIDPGQWIPSVIELAPEMFSYSKIADYANDCIEKNKDKYISYTKMKTVDVLKSDFHIEYGAFAYGNDKFSDVDSILLDLTFPLSFMHCLFLVGVSLIFALLVLIIRKKITWQVIGLSAFIFTHIFVSIVASMAEFSRLSVMIVPAVFILLFYCIDLFFSALLRKKDGKPIIEATKITVK